MTKLQHVLKNSDSGARMAFAQSWGVTIAKLSEDKQIAKLQDSMLDAARVEAVWDMLNQDQRGALQMLASQRGRSMGLSQFQALFGKIRKMGRGEIEREQPHLNPTSTAEALFYRGFIAEDFQPLQGQLQPIVFIPEDLCALLPLHKTSYSNLEGEDLPEADEDDEDDEESVASPELALTLGRRASVALPVPAIVALPEVPQGAQFADTSVIDDLVTLLAFLRVQPLRVEGDSFLPPDAERVMPHLLRPDAARLTFLLCLGVSAELIMSQDGLAYVRRDGLQRWLNLPRYAQLRRLADAWLTSRTYHELWHVADLWPDDNFAYDPQLARQALLEAMHEAPSQAWWPTGALIARMKAQQPNFQRSEYDSWYIRGPQNAYLKGFASWDAVEGALLTFLMNGPLHWLGLLDVAQGAAHLTAYGRGWLGLAPYPQPPDPDEKIIVRSDGTLIASRKVARVERFQVARFSQWLGLRDGQYHYRVDAQSLAWAAEQGIHGPQIETFLRRQLPEGRDLPVSLLRLLHAPPPSAASAVSLERAIVLRTTSKEMLDHLFDDPKTRRFLGARLGDLAAIVRPEGVDALQSALLAAGYPLSRLE
ncbi:MAG: hypothetical protein NZ750_14185 [Anaerolineae bacterium]|nr:hypothetical protein [Anaerolineae bacterium]MDW8173751.1 hypothetical protein [Anaerolineae bacterium]